MAIETNYKVELLQPLELILEEQNGSLSSKKPLKGRYRQPGQDSGENDGLVMKHYPMIRAIAYRIHQRLPRTVDVEDLISVGTLGLIEAIGRYDSTRCVPFPTYARHRVHGSIVDSLRAQDWVPRSVRRKADQLERTRGRLRQELGYSPSAQEMADDLGLDMEKYETLVHGSEIRTLLSLDAPMANDNPTPLVEQVADFEIGFVKRWEELERSEILREAIQKLPNKERTAIVLRSYHGLTLMETGKALGVTESRACQIESQARKRLKFRLRND
jgi:RNA polymerase sigma factor FliA